MTGTQQDGLCAGECSSAARISGVKRDTWPCSRENVPVRRLLALSLLILLSACESEPIATPPTPSTLSSVPANDPAQPRSKLAARAAAAKDLRQVALYVLKTAGRPDRTVSIQRATDGSWRVDVPGSAHGGAVDIALVFTGGELHQCALPSGAEPRSGCVRLNGGILPKTSDPKLSHLITDWLNLFTDMHQALAVSITQPLEGATGDCFSIESAAVSLQMPLDAGIYCYERDGTLTAARFSAGTMVLTGRPGAAPPTLPLPGPLVGGAPLPLAAPPSAVPSGSSTS